MELETLNLTRIKIKDRVHLTSMSSRQAAAKRKLASISNHRGLTHEHVTKFLQSRLNRLYERVKVNGALTNDKVSEYLSMFTSAAIPVLGDISRTNQESVIKNFAISTKQIVDKISDEGYVEPRKIVGVKLGIVRKSKTLFNKNIDERAIIVDDIGVDISKVSEESERKAKISKSATILKDKIIPIGLQKNAELMTVEEFLNLPLGHKALIDNNENPFAEHLLYLKKASELKLFPKKSFQDISDITPLVNRKKYKKYFQVFNNDMLVDSVFMAVISLWQNNALENLVE